MKEKKISKFQIWVTVIGFLGLLFVPSIAWVFCHGALEEDTGENRKLAEMPEFELGKISTFPKEFEDFWNDHVPFRGKIASMWTRLNYFGLGDSTNSEVTLGKTANEDRDRWLFYSKESDYDPVSDAQGILRYGPVILKKTTENMKKNEKYFEKKNIQFWYFIIPNKENVYKEYLPVEIYNDESRGERLIAYAIENGVKRIGYAKDEIEKNKHKGQLYLKQDTHWNELGAFYGYKALMNMIEPKYNDFDYNVSLPGYTTENLDLTRMINIRSYFRDERPKVSYNEGVDYKIVKNELIGGDNGSFIVTENKNAKIDKKVMVAGDSFRTGLIPYMAKTFKQVVFLHILSYDSSLLETYKPDIVISEGVERRAMVVGNYDFSAK